MQPHTDINTKGWIQKLPPKLQPYALLMRLDRPIGSWLLFLPASWSILLASGGYENITSTTSTMLVLFAIGAIIMRGAGCAINDYWDREYDAKVERTKSRPIASGAITPKQALLFIALLLLIGLSILIQMPLSTITTGSISLIFVILYPLMKRWTWWPQVFLGFTINFGALMGWSAITQGLDHIAPFLLYISALFWTLGYDTIYAFQDIKDDKRANIKSSARALQNNAKPWIGSFYTVTYAGLLATGLSLGCGWPYYALVTLGGVQLLWQFTFWDPESPQKSLKIFRSNRDFAIIITLACIWSF